MHAQGIRFHFPKKGTSRMNDSKSPAEQLLEQFEAMDLEYQRLKAILRVNELQRKIEQIEKEARET